jgi:hypothetical protein
MIFSDNDKALLDWLTRLNTFMPHKLHPPSTLDVSVQEDVIVLRLGRTIPNRMQARKLERELPPPSRYGIQIWMGEKEYGFLPPKRAAP